MTKRYTSVRIDTEIKKLLEDRQKRINDHTSRLMGKPVRISKIRVIKLSLKNPLYLGDGELKRMGRKKRL